MEVANLVLIWVLRGSGGLQRGRCTRFIQELQVEQGVCGAVYGFCGVLVSLQEGAGLASTLV